MGHVDIYNICEKEQVKKKLIKSAKKKAKKVRLATEMENPGEEKKISVDKSEIKQKIADDTYDHSLHFTHTLSHQFSK